METKQHPHALLIIEKARNMDLAVFTKCDAGWLKISEKRTLPIEANREYFLCNPKYADHCLKWLNGAEYLVKLPALSTPQSVSKLFPEKVWQPLTIWMNVYDELEFTPVPKIKREQRALIYDNGKLVAEVLENDLVIEWGNAEGYQIIRVEVDIVVS